MGTPLRQQYADRSLYLMLSIVISSCSSLTSRLKGEGSPGLNGRSLKQEGEVVPGKGPGKKAA